MCNVRFIGCLHLGHKWMHEHRGFNAIYDHDEHLIYKWNKTVHKRDLTYILGDVTMETSEHYYQLDRLNGRKIVVLGNHDKPKDVRELLKYVETVGGMVDYKGFVLTHCPIHPSEIGFCRGNIHAHVHENKIAECEVPSRYTDADSVITPTLHKYYNVDAANIGFKPQTIEDLLKQREK